MARTSPVAGTQTADEVLDSMSMRPGNFPTGSWRLQQVLNAGAGTGASSAHKDDLESHEGLMSLNGWFLGICLS